MSKILHLIPSLMGGGAERQLTILATEQVKHGWNVHVGMRRDGIYTAPLQSSDVIVHSLGDYRGIDFRLFLQVNKLIKKIKPDIIQTWLPQMDIVGGLCAFLNSTPWILTERSAKEAYRGFLCNVIRKNVAKCSCAIVANSLHGVQFWREIYDKKKEIFCVNNAINFESIRGAESGCIEFRSPKNTDIKFLFVGRLEKIKNIHLFVHACNEVFKEKKGCALIIGNGSQRNAIEKEINKLNLVENLSLSPYRDDWWGFLKCAAALVNVSSYEGQPNVVIEAIAAGCPVIVSDIPAHREILDDESALFVQPGDAGHLAKAMKRILMEPEAARHRADLAFKRVIGMTIESSTKQYFNIYHKVLGNLTK